MIRVAIVTGSTCPGRNNEAVVGWTFDLASERSDADFELVDIAGYSLPLLHEPSGPTSDPDDRVVFALSRHRSSDPTEITSGGWFVNGPSLPLVLANYRYPVTMPSVRELLWQDPLWSKAGPFYNLVAGEHQTVVEEGSFVRFFSPTLPVLSIACKPLLLAELSSSPAARNTSAGISLSPRPDTASPSHGSIEERLQMLERLKQKGLITVKNTGRKRSNCSIDSDSEGRARVSIAPDFLANRRWFQTGLAEMRSKKRGTVPGKGALPWLAKS
jgi:NADPH-dependent FMN reductase